MRTLQEIDQELERTRQKTERLRKLDVILEDLSRQRENRRKTEAEARKLLEKEQGDVEELERMSLVAFLARIQGNLENRKEEERREAAMAKARYDAARWDLEDLDRRIRDAQEERQQLSEIPRQYQALLDEKEQVLHSQGGSQSKRLGELAQGAGAHHRRAAGDSGGDSGRHDRPSGPERHGQRPGQRRKLGDLGRGRGRRHGHLCQARLPGRRPGLRL